MRRIGTVLAMIALVAVGVAPAATAEQLPPNNTDWLLTASQASAAVRFARSRSPSERSG